MTEGEFKKEMDVDAEGAVGRVHRVAAFFFVREINLRISSRAASCCTRGGGVSPSPTGGFDARQRRRA